MSKPPDIEDLARRYVELWQQHIAATASDPALTEGMTRFFQMIGTGVPPWGGLWQAPASRGAAAATTPSAETPGVGTPTSEAASAEDRIEPAFDSPPSGTAAPAAAPDARRSDLERIEARLAALEERLSALESGRLARPRTARPGTRLRRP